MENNIYDLIIVGFGPAGLSAAIYASRYKLNTLIVGVEIGGMMSSTHLIDNYPGLPNISGKDLSLKMMDHLKQYDNCNIVKDSVNSIQKIDNNIYVSTENGQMFQGKALILGLGAEKKRANIIGEDKFLGKGLSYCTVCDGMFYKDKVTLIMGDPDHAAIGALHLSNISKQIYFVLKKDQSSIKDLDLISKIKLNKNIEILENSEVKEVIGENKVEKVIIKRNDIDEEIKIDGLFIEAGSVPQSTLFKNISLDCNEQGFIKIDNDCRTNIDGVYAVGDMTTGFADLKQIIVAGAMGAIAATSVRKYLN